MFAHRMEPSLRIPELCSEIPDELKFDGVGN